MHLVVLTTTAASAELAADALWAAGATGVAEQVIAGDLVEVSGDADPGQVAEGEWQVRVEALDPAQPWLDEWRAHAMAIRIGPIHLVPAWQTDHGALDGAHVIRLDPGRTFGGGTHPTTVMAIAALHVVDPADVVLDVGCGSGVLSLAALAYGASRVTAIDVDPAAVEATRDNAARNGVADRIVASTTPLADVAPVAAATPELIVANIGAATLREMAAALASRSPRRLILTGLLDRDDPVDVPGYAILATDRDAGWRCDTYAGTIL